jgi:hypothetical protein
MALQFQCGMSLKNGSLVGCWDKAPFFGVGIRQALWDSRFFFPPFSSWMESSLAKALGCLSRTFFE